MFVIVLNVFAGSD